MIGIYKILNLTNQKIYIGSSNDIKNRWRQHKFALKNNKHHSPYLQNAWNKYGEDSFEFKTLEECTSENLVIKEQYYLDTIKPEYNICKIAENCIGRIMSEESKKKISLKNTGRKHSKETKEKMSKYRKENPIVFTDETKEKISISKKGSNNPMYGKTLSKDHIKSIKKANKGKKLSKETKDAIGKKNSIPIVQLNLQGELIKTWDSTMEVERELGFFGSGITKVCKGNGITYKGFKWKYKKEFDMNNIKKTEIYTNKDNQDFKFEMKEAYFMLDIANGCNYLCFLSSNEVDEFCKLLQSKKKEVWEK